MDDQRPVAAVWKTTWLPASQTFVQNQVGAMSAWRPLLLGVRRVPGLDVTPDRAPFGTSTVGRVAHRASRATGYLGVYDGILRRSRARVIHAHFGTDAVRGLPIARRSGLPLLVTFHGYDVTSEPLRADATGARYRAGLREVFSRADTLIAVSAFVRTRLLELGAPPEKVRVHHIGVPVDQVAESPPGEHRSGVVFVGRLVETKGVDDLLRAVAAQPSRPQLRVVGDGPLLHDLRRAAEALGVDAVFLGQRHPREVAGILRSAAVFCAPSKTSRAGASEAFGMVFLEAALHGLPVVSYRHGGIPEAVEDGRTALLAPEGDVDALAAHLSTLLSDPARSSAMGEAGRQRVLTSFDVRDRTAELEELYAEAVRRHRG